LMLRKPKVDLEMAQFQADLLPSVRERKAGTFAHSTQERATEALQARAKMDLSQSQFAKLLGVSVRTLQEWEQGRKKPTGAAQTLLRVAVQTPQALLGLAQMGFHSVEYHPYAKPFAIYSVASHAIFHWPGGLKHI
jgi:putative transcriptional regulator